MDEAAKAQEEALKKPLSACDVLDPAFREKRAKREAAEKEQEKQQQAKEKNGVEVEALKGGGCETSASQRKAVKA